MMATRGSLTTERTTARILVVGYDGTDPARAALAAAIDRAGPDDIVVGVYARMPVFSWLGTPYYERAVEAAVQTGQASSTTSTS